MSYFILTKIYYTTFFHEYFNFFDRINKILTDLVILYKGYSQSFKGSFARTRNCRVELIVAAGEINYFFDATKQGDYSPRFSLIEMKRLIYFHLKDYYSPGVTEQGHKYSAIESNSKKQIKFPEVFDADTFNSQKSCNAHSINNKKYIVKGNKHILTFYIYIHVIKKPAWVFI